MEETEQIELDANETGPYDAGFDSGWENGYDEAINQRITDQIMRTAVLMLMALLCGLLIGAWGQKRLDNAQVVIEVHPVHTWDGYESK